MNIEEFRNLVRAHLKRREIRVRTVLTAAMTSYPTLPVATRRELAAILVPEDANRLGGA